MKKVEVNRLTWNERCENCKLPPRVLPTATDPLSYAFLPNLESRQRNHNKRSTTPCLPQKKNTIYSSNTTTTNPSFPPPPIISPHASLSLKTLSSNLIANITKHRRANKMADSLFSSMFSSGASSCSSKSIHEDQCLHPLVREMIRHHSDRVKGKGKLSRIAGAKPLTSRARYQSSDPREKPFPKPFMLHDLEGNCQHLAMLLAENGGSDAEDDSSDDESDLSPSSALLRWEDRVSKWHGSALLAVAQEIGKKRRGGSGDWEDDDGGDDARTLAEREQPVMHSEEKSTLPEPRPKGDEDEITVVNDETGEEEFYGLDSERKDDDGVWTRFLTRREEDLEPLIATTTSETEGAKTTAMSKYRKGVQSQLERMKTKGARMTSISKYRQNIRSRLERMKTESARTTKISKYRQKIGPRFEHMKGDRRDAKTTTIPKARQNIRSRFERMKMGGSQMTAISKYRQIIRPRFEHMKKDLRGARPTAVVKARQNIQSRFGRMMGDLKRMWPSKKQEDRRTASPGESKPWTRFTRTPVILTRG
ncbi:hypothetical protein BDV96DRAFT_100239 [Lophiotrema nucula]|uniref:Uncharacterized protein n=1 Tax=Lophiotrema nucula TaxID=690887 RepID=A0A6A5Z586_9PLEO|nr:hypothetical protein BDV96DRAFT_100239 [Lophiotrema nucula]